MADPGTDNFVAPETMALIGTSTPLGNPKLVDRNTIGQFAVAIGSTNPLFTDAAAAQAAGEPGIVAPLSYPIYNVPNGTDRDFVLNLRNTNRVRGGDDCEFIAPIHEGDTLTAQTKLLSIVHRKGSTGDLVITTFETRYTNQRGELVMVERPTGVWR